MLSPGSESAAKRPRLEPRDGRNLLKICAKRLVVDRSRTLEPGFVLVADGKIAAIGGDESASPLARACERKVEADIVVPGFIDIHTHGIGGAADIAEFWQHPEFTLARVVKYGTTALLATLVFPVGSHVDGAEDCGQGAGKPSAAEFCQVCFTGSVCRCQALAPRLAGTVRETVAKLKAVQGKLGYGAVLEGIHAEGPIVETLGGLPKSDTSMSSAAFEELLNMLGSGLKVMTIAPSLEARSDPPFTRLRMLLERGIRPALGHDTGCTVSEVAAALKHTAADGTPLHVTHCLNVQRFHHRDCGLANFALLPKPLQTPEFAGVVLPTVELIGDSLHVSPLALQLAVACKPAGTACFITDGIAEPVVGHRMLYAGREATVESNCGRLGVYSTSAKDGAKVLIGSCAMMLDAFRTAVKVLGIGLEQAVDMCCCTPASVAGLSHLGTLQPGKRADLVCLDSDLKVQQVLVSGTCVYTA